MAIPYRTRDLNEAAFLWCQPGTDLEGLEPTETRGRSDTYLFVFTLDLVDAELKQLLISYVNEKTTVEPQMFIRKINNLRDRVYSLRRRKVNEDDD
jgi:hypothetical protein